MKTPNEKLYADCIKILFKAYPPDKYDPVSIHECAKEWVSKYAINNGIVAYYKAYYSNRYLIQNEDSCNQSKES